MGRYRRGLTTHSNYAMLFCMSHPLDRDWTISPVAHAPRAKTDVPSRPPAPRSSGLIASPPRWEQTLLSRNAKGSTPACCNVPTWLSKTAVVAVRRAALAKHPGKAPGRLACCPPMRAPVGWKNQVGNGERRGHFIWTD